MLQISNSLAGEIRSQNQVEFPFGLNSSISAKPASSVVSKRSRGRPKGPRGFVFSTYSSGGALACFRRAHAQIEHARTSSATAYTYRRCDGPRSYYARLRAADGRQCVHQALALLLAGCLLTKGGAL